MAFREVKARSFDGVHDPRMLHRVPEEEDAPEAQQRFS